AAYGEVARAGRSARAAASPLRRVQRLAGPRLAAPQRLEPGRELSLERACLLLGNDLAERAEHRTRRAGGLGDAGEPRQFPDPRHEVLVLVLQRQGRMARGLAALDA